MTWRWRRRTGTVTLPLRCLHTRQSVHSCVLLSLFPPLLACIGNRQVLAPARLPAAMRPPCVREGTGRAAREAGHGAAVGGTVIDVT